MITQEDLNDLLVRDLNLSKGKSELLGSRLQQWNLLSSETKVSFYHQRSKALSVYLTSTDGEICYYNDIPAVFKSIGINYNPDDKRTKGQTLSSTFLLCELEQQTSQMVYGKKRFFRICSTYGSERTEESCYRLLFLPYCYSKALLEFRSAFLYL